MNALRILLTIVLIIYLCMYHLNYWKYFFAVLIPYYVLTQFIFFDSKLNTPKSKSFISMWSEPADPQIYGRLSLNVTKTEEFLKKYSERVGVKIGFTVFFMKLMAVILGKYPQVNGNVLFGKFIAKQSNDVSIMVACDEDKETELITVRSCDKMKLEEISKKVKEKKESFDKGTDKAHNKRLFVAKLLPTFLLSPFVRIMSFLSAMGFNLTWLFLPKYFYGTCIIANISSLDVDGVYLPIPPYTYAPLLISITGTSKKIKIDETTHKLTESSHVSLYFTVDHRYLDGSLAGKVANDIDKVVNFSEEDMEKFINNELVL